MWISCDFLLPKRILIGSISWSHETDLDLDLDLDPPKWSTTLLNSNKEQRSVSLWTGSLCSYPFSEKTDPTKNLLKNCWFKNKNNDCFCLFISLLFMCVITNTKSNFNQNKLRFFWFLILKMRIYKVADVSYYISEVEQIIEIDYSAYYPGRSLIMMIVWRGITNYFLIRAFDVRPAVKEQVESMGAEFLEVSWNLIQLSRSK